MMRVVSYWLFALLLCAGGALGQQPDTSRFSQAVSLDVFVVSSGFDVQAFIRRVRADTTFYKAFKSMRLVPCTMSNDIKVLDKHGYTTASLESKTKQKITAGCRTTEVLEQKVTGDFYKRNGDYNYYTAKLYAYLFFADKPQCNENDIVAGALDARGEGQLEKSKYELKQLMFNPGGKVNGVPFMGAHASIFDMPEAAKYEFSIRRDTAYATPCFLLTIKPKAGREHDVVYNEMNTWFRTTDYSILARDYSLSYHTLVYDFDVRMRVLLRQAGAKLFPSFISYYGNWQVLTKKRERVKFTTNISY